MAGESCKNLGARLDNREIPVSGASRKNKLLPIPSIARNIRKNAPTDLERLLQAAFALA